MLEDPTDSDSEIEDLYEGDDDDAEAEVEVEDEVGEPAMTPGEDATEEGDVCVHQLSNASIFDFQLFYRNLTQTSPLLKTTMKMKKTTLCSTWV